MYLPATPGQRTDTAASGRRHAGAEVILLVEDDDAVRRVVRRILDSGGYEVIEASNGREALGIVEHRGESFDLVVTDAVMPRLGGPELARSLRRESPGLRVLFMSGYAFDDIGCGGDEYGGSAFLGKPFSPGELLGRVRDLLDDTGMATAGGMGG